MDALWHAEIEGEALAIYHQAKLEPDRPIPIGRLVRELLHTKITRSPMISNRQAAIYEFNGQYVIGVRRGIPGPRARWLAAHELAHWWFDRMRYIGEDIETRCDALGAALIVPMPAWRHVRQAVGCKIRDLAEALATTQSIALLRHGECDGVPVALIEARHVLVRGDAWGWPSESEIRRVAKTGVPGVKVVRITDEARRSGLIAG